MLKVKEDGLNIIFMLIQNFKELVFENHPANQGCKTDRDNCEFRLRKNAILQIKQFSFLCVGRNRNTTQFDILGGSNCESYFIEVFFFKNCLIETGF